MTDDIKRVVIESRYAGDTQLHRAYGCAVLRDCLLRGEAPFASHMLYTQPGVLDDANPADRKLGMTAGLCWTDVADVVVVYTDHGISDGMRSGIRRAMDGGVRVEYRTLTGRDL